MRTVCGIGRGPSSIPLWEGAVPSPPKILDFEKTYFCRLFSAKIYLYNHMGCNAWWLTVDV